MLLAAITTFGASPWLPNIAASRSPCSTLVGRPGARASALHVDHHERDLRHRGEPDRLLLERVARAGGDRDRASAGVGRADRERARGDLVLGLMDDAAGLLEHRRSGSARRRWPGVIGYIAQMSMPEASTPSASAVLPLTTICGCCRSLGGDRVAEVEVLLRPRPARLEQLDVLRDHPLVLLAERRCEPARARAPCPRL